MKRAQWEIQRWKIPGEKTSHSRIWLWHWIGFMCNICLFRSAFQTSIYHKLLIIYYFSLCFIAYSNGIEILLFIESTRKPSSFAAAFSIAMKEKQWNETISVCLHCETTWKYRLIEMLLIFCREEKFRNNGAKLPNTDKILGIANTTEKHNKFPIKPNIDTIRLLSREEMILNFRSNRVGRLKCLKKKLYEL